MDPKETLLLLSRQVTTGQIVEAKETLKAYREWRAKGGFEPVLAGLPGDKVADGYAQRIQEGLSRKPPRYKFRYWNRVKYVAPNNPAPPDFVRCGHCKRAWDDARSTDWTPAPSGRCPFEYWHK